MKTHVKFTALLLAMMVVMTGAVQAQKTSKIKEIKIKVSAQCGMCKDRIERALTFEKGVKSAEVDLETKTVTVTYNETKTTPDKIRLAISKLGHDADDVKADEKAYSKLPACCKKPDDASHQKME